MMLLQSPMITSHSLLSVDLYGVGREALMITGVWCGVLMMVVVQHLIKRHHAMKQAGSVTAKEGASRCNRTTQPN